MEHAYTQVVFFCRISSSLCWTWKFQNIMLHLSQNGHVFCTFGYFVEWLAFECWPNIPHGSYCGYFLLRSGSMHRDRSRGSLLEGKGDFQTEHNFAVSHQS